MRVKNTREKYSVSEVPVVTLNDGNTIPQLGLGVYQVAPDKTVETVQKALATGYRHIDTAEMYQNEAEVGEAIAASGINRADIFITSKLNNGFHEPEAARQAFAETLRKLQTDYIDLFLIHWPLPRNPDVDYVETWKVMEEFKHDGRARSIGVSNFQVPHLERLLQECDTVPAVNQIELHPYFQNREVATYNRDHQIVTEAWSPIARGDVMNDQTILAIAEEVNETPAQVTLRWHIQHGFVVFPKSVTPARIEENYAIFDFVLSDEQMQQIDGLDRGEDGRHGPNPDTLN
jgi:2,5-diketo-D-gluconate reductase A